MSLISNLSKDKKRFWTLSFSKPRVLSFSLHLSFIDFAHDTYVTYKC